MIKTISNTAFTLAIIAVLNFILVTLVFRELGKPGTTDMGLIVLGISFISMISNIIGGSALVYLTTRESNVTLLFISYVWAVISSIIMGFILYIFKLVPMDFFWWVLVIGFFECIFSSNNQLFIGKGEMFNLNFIKLAQKIIQVTLFISLGISVYNFVFALVISYLFVLSCSFVLIGKGLTSLRLKSPYSLFRKAFTYGIQVQASNIVQLLNYRVLYFIIEKTMGSVLGLFIVAVQLTESLWIPSKALSIIQYSKVAKERDERKNSRLSLSYMKVSVIVTFVLLCVLLIIPNDIFILLFDKDIEGVKPIILSLAIGVIAMAFSQTFAHYFSGKGEYKFLINAAICGLVILLISGYFLINYYGVIGAGIATSLSYLASCMYLGKSFLVQSKFKLRDFLIKKNDLTEVIQLIKK